MAPLEDVLAAPPMQLEARRDLGRKVYEVVVEERDTDLDRRGHPHLVGVREVQAGEERLGVEVQETAELVAAVVGHQIGAVEGKRVVAGLDDSGHEQSAKFGLGVIARE